MKNTKDLCNERNAAFSRDETHPKKPERAHRLSDERRKGPPESQYDSDVRHRRYYSQFQEDGYREHAREHQRSGQLHNRNSGRQYGYDSDKSDDELGHSRKFIQPPKSLNYSRESNLGGF
ncbi:hypothetical protein PoB_001920800 [Plakobranchus ocellatus]|uniref:Uncharacterized protein n=1 Tax=Plakobranchus ocellatus TaxID=259542 RepID=A0AAV3ZD99_9GAST|nr:hypothetical protein PoB_001920800 [Plakobranchus ocellatus]